MKALTLGVSSLVAALAGFGWLYVLHRGNALGAGPVVPEALPLQRLAGGAGQPLSRLVLAWLPAGVVAGLALRAAGFGRARAPFVFAACLVLLMAMGAAADAVTASEPLARHLAPQLHRPATWSAAALIAIGAALP